MHETPNSYLSAYLIMVDIHALVIPHNTPILFLQRPSLAVLSLVLKPGRKPTHIHLKIRTYPYVVCVKSKLRKGKPNLYHPEFQDFLGGK
jgi:hypothetical protein